MNKIKVIKMNRSNKIYSWILFFIIIGVTKFYAQSPESNKVLSYTQFLENVKNNNLGYIVEKYNIDIANAHTEAAKVFPDPSLSLGGTDNQEQKLKMGYSLDAGLDYTLELGNKRKARIRLAQSEASVTNALLEDYFRNLRADATLSYLSALKQEQIVGVKKESYHHMKELAQADSIRFQLGAIMDIDARQSKLEASTLLNDVIQSEVDWKNTLIRLSFEQGDKTLSVPNSLAGSLTFYKRSFDLVSLITTAQNERSDLEAALRSKEVSQRNLQLAKANRAIDLGINIGVSKNAEVRNEIAPAPAFTAVTAGISIPLKFSNTNKGEVRAAQLAVQQSETAYAQTELQIQMEVTQAYLNYVATCQQVEQFNTGLLSEAKKIFENKYYSYERGNTSLLEVLNAQRTYNEIQENYFEAQYNCAAALIELERACGIWDIQIE